MTIPTPKGKIGRLILKALTRDRTVEVRELTVGLEQPEQFITALRTDR
jgi:hypothetical protein